jgi:hypothetical protein
MEDIMVHGTIKVALPENGVACHLAEKSDWLLCLPTGPEVKVQLRDAA